MVEQKEIYRGRKFHQVCRGARQIFLRDGYEGASVDDISRAAGVSKATLYSYFPHKQLMFEEIMRNEIVEAERMETALPDPALSPEQGLSRLVTALSRDAVSDLQTGIYRMGIAEARRFPKLARDYYERVPEQRVQLLTAALDRWVERGDLTLEDSGLAAAQLWRLTGATLTERAAMLPHIPLTEAAIGEICESAVALFLRAYAPRNSGAAR